MTSPTVSGAGTVLVQGKGEQLLSLRALPECWFVVCKPQVSFSTAEMYRRLDEAGMAVHRTPAG